MPTNSETLERKVTKAIITASYDDSGPNVDDKVRETAEVEKKSGNRFINHLILRNKTHARDRLKFNFLLPPGVPAIVYSLMNVNKSDLQEIVVVGNSDTGAIVEEFNKVYGVSLGKIKFNHEGEDWSLSNTLSKGREALSDASGMVLYLPGDVPLAFNLKSKINDRDVSEVDKEGRMYDAILDLNSKRRVGKYFPRNYHMKVIYNAVSYWVKEPNIFLLDLDKVSPELIDSIYGGRKTYMKGGGRGKTIGDLFVNNGKWRGSLEALGLDVVPLGLKAIPILKKYFEHGTGITKWSSKIFLGPMSGIINLFSSGIVSVRSKTIERIAEHTLGLKTRIKVKNDDPGTLEDLDSLQDWTYLTQMLNENGKAIYPNFNELEVFRREAMPNLRERIPMYRHWGEYMNNLFERYGLNPPYESNGNFNMPFDNKATKRMIRKNLRFHRRYVRSWRKGRKN